MLPLIEQKVMYEPWAVMLGVHDAIVRALYGERNVQQSQFAGVQVPFTECALTAGLARPTSSGSRVWTRGALAVVPVSGIIGSHLSGLELMCGGYDVAQLSRDMDEVQGREDIKRVLFAYHSPGGTVTGLPEAAKQMRALGNAKDTFAFTDGQSASASYWLMSQANNIYMTESASVGSIGVFIAALDRSKEAEMKGVKVDLIADGKFKGMGYPGTSLTPEQRELLVAQVQETSDKFKSAVKSRRSGVSSETMQGQMFRGAAARKAGLVDSLTSSFKSLVSSLSN